MSHNSGIDLVDTINAGCLDTLTRIPLGMLFITLGCYLGVSATEISEVSYLWWQQNQTPNINTLFHDILWAPKIILTSIWGLILAPLCYFTITFFTHSTNSRVIWAYGIIALWSCVTAFATIQPTLCPYWFLALTLPLWLTPSALLARFLYHRELNDHLAFVESLREETEKKSTDLIRKVQQNQTHTPPALTDNKPLVPTPSASENYRLKPKPTNTQSISNRSSVLKTYTNKPTPTLKSIINKPLINTQKSNKSPKYKIILNPISKRAITSRQSKRAQNRPIVPIPKSDS